MQIKGFGSPSRCHSSQSHRAGRSPLKRPCNVWLCTACLGGVWSAGEPHHTRPSGAQILLWRFSQCSVNFFRFPLRDKILDKNQTKNFRLLLSEYSVLSLVNMRKFTLDFLCTWPVHYQYCAGKIFWQYVWELFRKLPCQIWFLLIWAFSRQNVKIYKFGANLAR